MSPLATLDGVPEGKDLAIQTGGSVQRWQVTADGGLTRDGHTLEPFFLTGLLRDGRVMDGDFSPAQAGEWFNVDGRAVLVLAVEGVVVHTAQFRHGEFYRWSMEEQLVERGHRIPSPDWVGNGALFQVTQMAWNSSKTIDTMRERARNHSRARDYMRYVRDYTNSALELLEP